MAAIAFLTAFLQIWDFIDFFLSCLDILFFYAFTACVFYLIDISIRKCSKVHIKIAFHRIRRISKIELFSF